VSTLGSPGWVVTALGGVAAVLAGVPLTAFAFAVSGEGGLGVPDRWWRGGPAPRWAVLVAPALIGVAAVFACLRCECPAVVAAFWLTAVLGTTMAVIDLRCRRLPHALTAVVSSTAVVCFSIDAILSGDARRLIVAVSTGLVTATGLFVVALALPGQFGLGDVTFAGALALSLGWLCWTAAPAGLLATFCLQAAAVLGLRLTRRWTSATRISFPMGPALVLGWLAVVWAIPAPR